MEKKWSHGKAFAMFGIAKTAKFEKKALDFPLVK